MTKATIVEKLLQEKLISAEEAVILLSDDNKKEVVYIPYSSQPITYPTQPWYPSYPVIYSTSQAEPIYNNK